MPDLPTPYSDYLYIDPVVDQGAVLKTLNSYAKVLAIGPDVKDTKIGDYILFEKWDKPEVLLKDDKVVHFIREKDAICKIPESWL